MSNYRCEDCGLDMIEDNSSGPEPCPRCGKDMVRSEGVVLKNFGGGGFAAPDQPVTGKIARPET